MCTAISYQQLFLFLRGFQLLQEEIFGTVPQRLFRNQSEVPACGIGRFKILLALWKQFSSDYSLRKMLAFSLQQKQVEHDKALKWIATWASW